jgi:hypothetical protein
MYRQLIVTFMTVMRKSDTKRNGDCELHKRQLLEQPAISVCCVRGFPLVFATISNFILYTYIFPFLRFNYSYILVVKSSLDYSRLSLPPVSQSLHFFRALFDDE